MATRKESNKYYPPNWDPSMGSVNAMQGIHPLRERANRLKTEGILVVRFEMPFNVWCTGCERQISKAVRFNAEKSQIGMYHSTPIWQFQMKCPRCSGMMTIHTDPKTGGEAYVMVSGVRKRQEEWKPGPDDGFGVLSEKRYDETHRERLRSDPLYRLEQGRKDALSAEAGARQIEQLEQLVQEESDVYSLNQLIRKRARQDRKASQAVVARLAEQRKRTGFVLPLLSGGQLTTENTLEKEAESLRQSVERISQLKQLEYKVEVSTSDPATPSRDDPPELPAKRIQMASTTVRIIPKAKLQGGLPLTDEEEQAPHLSGQVPKTQLASQGATRSAVQPVAPSEASEATTPLPRHVSEAELKFSPASTLQQVLGGYESSDEDG